MGTGPGDIGRGVLNAAILQKIDIIPKPLLCMFKFRANNTEITIKNLSMNVRSGSLDKIISNIHWRIG